MHCGGRTFKDLRERFPDFIGVDLVSLKAAGESLGVFTKRDPSVVAIRKRRGQDEPVVVRLTTHPSPIQEGGESVAPPIADLLSDLQVDSVLKQRLVPCRCQEYEVDLSTEHFISG